MAAPDDDAGTGRRGLRQRLPGCAAFLRAGTATTEAWRRGTERMAAESAAQMVADAEFHLEAQHRPSRPASPPSRMPGVGSQAPQTPAHNYAISTRRGPCPLRPRRRMRFLNETAVWLCRTATTPTRTSTRAPRRCSSRRWRRPGGPSSQPSTTSAPSSSAGKSRTPGRRAAGHSQRPPAA